MGGLLYWLRNTLNWDAPKAEKAPVVLDLSPPPPPDVLEGEWTPAEFRDSEDELAVARRAEEDARERDFLATVEKLSRIEPGAVWLYHSSFRGYPEQTLGPFPNEEAASYYLSVKRGQQRGNHQEYFAKHPLAAPRHIGDLFVMPDAQWVVITDGLGAKLREALAIRAGEGHDHNKWQEEQETGNGQVY